MIYRSNCSNDARAFSLIETAIVLGVVGLVIGGIWAAAASINSRMLINRTVEDILTIRERTNRMFTISMIPVGGGLNLISYDQTETAGVSMKLLPDNWIVGGYARHTYGGIVNFQIIDDPADNDVPYAYLSLLGPFPGSDCMNIVNRLMVIMSHGGREERMWLTGVPSGWGTFSYDPGTYGIDTEWLANVCAGPPSELRINWNLTRAN